MEEFGDDSLIVDEDIEYHSTESAFPVLLGNEALRDRISDADPGAYG
ncbi:MAG: hypothetical protein U5K84_14860 [Alkalibacterium sp.]|nr:hypothetical protein [Alkalibacterium sp.]